MTKPTHVSIDLRTIPLKYLVQRVQTLQDQEERIRDEKAHIKGIIGDRIRAGESEHEANDLDEGVAEKLAADVPPAERIDAVAPGCILEAKATSA